MSDQRLDIEGFTEEERSEILKQIEDLSKRSAIKVNTKTFQYSPKRRGGTFPLLINIMALLIIGAVIYISSQLFQARQEALSVSGQGFLTTEGKLLEELKRESERKLGEKEREISQIQQEMEQIDRERADLESNLETRVQEKELELKAVLDAALEEERQRLQALGVSAEEVEQQLEQFRIEQEAAFNQQLAAFRQESERALAEKQQELEEARGIAEQILDRANREQQELLAESSQREEELRSRFEQQRLSMEAESSEIAAELQALAQARQNEQLFMDQLYTLYRAALAALEAEDPPAATAAVEELQSLLRSERADALPAVRNRRAIDLFLSDLIRDRITGIRSSAATGEERGIIESAQQLIAAEEAVKRGDQEAEEGRTDEAALFYNQALDLIPSLARAGEKLRGIRDQARAQRVEEYRLLAEESLSAGERDEAQLQLGSALLEGAASSEAIRSEALLALRELEALFTGQVNQLESRIAESNRELAALNQRVPVLSAERDSLQDQLSGLEAQLEEAEGRIRQAGDRQQMLEEELAARQSEVSGLEEAQKRLAQEISDKERTLVQVRERAQRVQNDLEEAVDQLASVVTASESNRTLRQAVSRYQQISSGAADSREEADSRLRELMQSNEIKSLFPGIETLLAKSVLAGQDGTDN